MDFKDALKLAREHCGYTQQQIADKMKITKSTYCGYETGKRQPDVQKIKQLATLLHTNADTLLGLEHKLSNSPTKDALQIAEEYDTLDSHGKATIRAVMDEELNRMEELLRTPIENPFQEPKVINLFLEPSAAGLAAPVEGKDYEVYELSDTDPQGAAYAVRLQGDSMEPAFPDGSIVFVNHDAIRDGDIGIFCVDSGTVCKQYYKRGGVVYLFSLNRAREDADVVLFPDGNRSFVCQGRVITKRRYPLPHEL